MPSNGCRVSALHDDEKAAFWTAGAKVEEVWKVAALRAGQLAGNKVWPQPTSQAAFQSAPSLQPNAKDEETSKRERQATPTMLVIVSSQPAGFRKDFPPADVPLGHRDLCSVWPFSSCFLCKVASLFVCSLTHLASMHDLSCQHLLKLGTRSE